GTESAWVGRRSRLSAGWSACSSGIARRMLPAGRHGRLAAVTHPSLGRPPLDVRAGFPADGAALRAGTVRVAARALEAAVAADPTFRDRYDELRLRELLADLHAFTARLAAAVAANDSRVMSSWAEQVAVRYRKR